MGDKLDLGWRILLSCTVPAIRFMMMIAVVMMAAMMMAAVMMAAMGGLPWILRVIRVVMRLVVMCLVVRRLIRLVVRRLVRLVVRGWLRRLVLASLVVAAMAWVESTLVMATVMVLMAWVVAAVMASVVTVMAWVVVVVTTVVFGDGCVRIVIALVRHRAIVALDAFIARMRMVLLSTIEILVERCRGGADKQSQGELHHL